MFKSPTLFILGAGASKEAGLPVGAELKKDISQKLNILFEPFEHYPSSGDTLIVEALRYHVRETEGEGKNITPYQNAGWDIRDGISQASSIDSFIDIHRDNKKIELCGKLAITKCILEEEGKSKLYFGQRELKNLNFDNLEGTWFNKFWRLLYDGVSKANINALFHNVDFISFNYDRCVEHFLFNAIKNFYNLDDVKASELVSRLSVYHPYGTVGRLPELEGDQKPIEFGKEIDSGQTLLELSRQIKTFTEQIDDEKEIAHIRKLIQRAKVVIFLGFAFHEQNMVLLRPDEMTNVNHVFLTSQGISANDRGIIIKKIIDTFGLQLDYSNIKFGTNCSELFQEYWRSLTNI